jgi:NADPH2:quinone reductase
MAFPKIVPHSDGAGVIEGGPRDGERVWLFNAQSGRPFGTAADYCVVPEAQAVRLPDSVSFVDGASLGIPGRTAHRAVFCNGAVRGKRVLVRAAKGSVGRFAIELARWGGAHVTEAGRGPAPDGLYDHIVEVDLAANAADDARVLAMGGTIASYATSAPETAVPFWPLVFQAATIVFVGVDSDPAHQRDAVDDLHAALAAGLLRAPIAARLPLDDIARAHELVEAGAPGRVLLDLA